MAPARGAQADGAREADGVPRDHPAPPSSTPSTRAATSTTASSTPRRAVASSTASTATRCRRCAGARSARACRPAGCSRPASGSSSSASASAWPSSPPATGTSRRRSPPSPRSPRSLATIDGNRVAGSRDFDSLGQTKRDDVAVLDEVGAQRLEGRPRRPAVRGHEVETKPYTSRPKPPFITSTLQQVGGIAAAHEQPPGDAHRPGPLRGRLHHLHAHRQHHAVRHRDHAPPAR